MAFCTNCGAPLGTGAKFCQECGNKHGDGGNAPPRRNAQGRGVKSTEDSTDSFSFSTPHADEAPPQYEAAALGQDEATFLGAKEYGGAWFAGRWLTSKARMAGWFCGAVFLGVYIGVYVVEVEETVLYLVVAASVAAGLYLLVCARHACAIGCGIARGDCFWPALHLAPMEICIWAYLSYLFSCEWDTRCMEAKVSAVPWWMFVPAYLMHALVSLSTPTIGALLYKTSFRSYDPAVNAWVAALEQRPSVTVSGEAYHYETRTRTVSDGKGGTKTETYQQKVVTASATENFNFRDFRVRGRTVDLATVKRWPGPCILQTVMYTTCADDETTQALKQQVGAMYARMAARDTHASASSNKHKSKWVALVVPWGGTVGVVVMRALIVLALVSGLSFAFECLAAFAVLNPHVAYVKEVTMRSVEGARARVVDGAATIVVQQAKVAKP